MGLGRRVGDGGKGWNGVAVTAFGEAEGSASGRAVARPVGMNTGAASSVAQPTRGSRQSAHRMIFTMGGMAFILTERPGFLPALDGDPRLSGPPVELPERRPHRFAPGPRRHGRAPGAPGRVPARRSER